MDQQAEKDRVTGLDRRTREEIAKWNQMTALTFQTGGRHQTSPVFFLGVCANSYTERENNLQPIYYSCTVN